MNSDNRQIIVKATIFFHQILLSVLLCYSRILGLLLRIRCSAVACSINFVEKSTFLRGFLIIHTYISMLDKNDYVCNLHSPWYNL